MKARLFVPIASGFALAGALFGVERLHVQSLRTEAQAVLDYGTAAALTSGPTRAEDAIRAQLPGTVARVEVTPRSEAEAVAVAEITLPSAWPKLRPNGHRQVLTSTVRLHGPARS